MFKQIVDILLYSDSPAEVLGVVLMFACLVIVIVAAIAGIIRILWP